MTLLIEPDAERAEAIRFALGGDVAVLESVPDVTRRLDEDPYEMLVVVGPDVDLTLALDLAGTLQLDRPHVGVVLMRHRIDVVVLGQALRVGVREVIVPDDLGALAAACRRSWRSPAAASARQVRRSSSAWRARSSRCSRPRAAAARPQSRRTSPRRWWRRNQPVCLVDLDLAFGDVAIALQLVPARTITDAVSIAGTMDEQGVRSLITPHGSGFDTLLAPLEPGEAERIDVKVVSELVRVLRRMYDYVVIDTPPAFSEHVLAAFDASDSYVLLATLDIPALKNLRLTLEMLDLLGYPRSSRLVVLNRSDSKVGLSTTEVERTLKVPIAVQIPSSRRCRRPSTAACRSCSTSPGTRQPGGASDRRAGGRAGGRPEPHPTGTVRTPAAPAVGPAPWRWAMNLSERIEQARRPSVGAATSTPGAVEPKARDPFAEVKASVHQALLDSLGPKLYDPRLEQSELEQRVRQTLQGVLEVEEAPLSSADRARITQEVADEILGSRTARAVPARPRRHRDHGQRPGQRLRRARRPHPPGRRRLHRRHPPAADHRQDRRPGRPPDRRVQPDGRRPTARRQPRQRRDRPRSPSTARCSPSASSPPTRSTIDDLIGFGTLTRAVARPARGLRPRPAEHPHQRRHRLGQDDDAQRAVRVHPARRAHRHHRGRRRAAAAAASTCVRLESRPPNIEGRGEVTIRDLVRNALRMRPDRIIVGEVRDGAALDMLQAMNTGHDGSITTLHANSPRDAAVSAGDDGADGRSRPADPRDPRAGIARRRPDRAPGAAAATARAASPSITEVVGMEGDVITLQDLFVLRLPRGS